MVLIFAIYTFFKCILIKILFSMHCISGIKITGLSCKRWYMGTVIMWERSSLSIIDSSSLLYDCQSRASWCLCRICVFLNSKFTDEVYIEMSAPKWNAVHQGFKARLVSDAQYIHWKLQYETCRNLLLRKYSTNTIHLTRFAFIDDTKLILMFWWRFCYKFFSLSLFSTQAKYKNTKYV